MSRGTASSASWSPRGAARWRTGRPISTRCTKIPRTWPKPSPWHSWACRSIAPAATTTRWRSGPTTITTAWPISSRGSRQRAGRRRRNADGDRVIFVADSGELIQPRTGHPQRPRPLDGKAVSFDSPSDRREALADWLTDPKNPYFSRRHREPRVGEFHGSGTGGGRRRHAAHQPGEQSSAVIGVGRRSGSQRVRLEVADATNSHVGRLPAFERRPSGQRGGRTVLFAVLRAAAEGRSVIGCRFPGDRSRRPCSTAARAARGPCSLPTPPPIPTF